MINLLGMDNWDFSRYPEKDYQLNWIRNYLSFYDNHNDLQTNDDEERLAIIYRQVNVCASVR
jgi:hypothetical protein